MGKRITELGAELQKLENKSGYRRDTKHSGDEYEGLGGILYRLSHMAENLEQWKEKQNEMRGCNGAAPGGVDPARKVDVCEIYSPPRITLQARKYGLRPGEAMDLMTGYDFDKEEDRRRAWNIFGEGQAYVISGIPRMQNV